MKQFGKIFGLALGFGILTAVLASIPSRPVAQAAGGSAPVTVINTTANPVPTSAQGTTAIAGTVGLASGSMVGINGNVTVGNTASSPVLVRDVDNAARHAFSIAGVVSLPIANNHASTILTTVPMDKRLVVEFVAVRITGSAGQEVEADLVLSGISGISFFPIASTTSAVGTTALLARVYVDRGETLTAVLSSPASVGSSAVFSLAGHFVDCGVGAGCPLP